MNERRRGSTWRGRPPGPEPKRLDSNRLDAPPREKWPEVPDLAPPPPPPEPPWPLPEEKPLNLEEELGDVRDDMAAIRAAREAEENAKDEARRRERLRRLPYMSPEQQARLAEVGKLLDAMKDTAKGNVPASRPNMRPEPFEAGVRLRAWGVDEGFAGVTWETLASLRKKKRLSFGEVETKNGRRLSGQAAVDEVRRRMQGEEIVVFTGEMGSGKTLALVAAWWQAHTGQPGVQFVHSLAHSLKRHDAATVVETLGRMERARRLFWDDLGYELERHEPDSAWSRNLAQPARDFLARWDQLGGDRSMVVTTNFDGAELADRYGPEGARRLVEHAEVIHFFRSEDDALLHALTNRDDD